MSNRHCLDALPPARDLTTREMETVTGAAGCVIEPPLRNQDLEVVQTVLSAFIMNGGRLPPFD